MMIALPSTPFPNPFEKDSIKDEISLDDDITQRLQSKELPLEVQLMLIPMWILRSKYYESTQPLDKAMEEYMDFRENLVKIDLGIENGSASHTEVSTAFNVLLKVFQVYEQNQHRLLHLLKQVSHQLSFYSQATRDDVLWNEMEKLKEFDELLASRRTCCFEHVVCCLLKLDESIKDSLQTSQDIARCCASYLMKIAELFQIKNKKTETVNRVYSTGNNDDESLQSLVTEMDEKENNLHDEANILNTT